MSETTWKEQARRRLFISHSKEDVELVDAVVKSLLECGVDGTQIMCSSLPGYGLRSGEQLDDGLRRELRSAAVVLLLATPSSLASLWVLLEVGAAWAGGEASRLALLKAGVPSSELPAFFTSYIWRDAENETQVLELLHDVSSQFVDSRSVSPARMAASARLVSSTAAVAVKPRCASFSLPRCNNPALLETVFQALLDDIEEVRIVASDEESGAPLKGNLRTVLHVLTDRSSDMLMAELGPALIKIRSPDFVLNFRFKHTGAMRRLYEVALTTYEPNGA